jgi:hypothetical protein
MCQAKNQGHRSILALGPNGPKEGTSMAGPVRGRAVHYLY